MQAVAEPGSRSGSAAEAAAGHGVSHEAPHVWCRKLLSGDGGGIVDGLHGRRTVSEECDRLPADEAELTQMALELRAEVRRLQIELDVRNATPDMAKKIRAPTRTG